MVRKEVSAYLDHLKWIYTKEDLEISRHTMQKYIGGPAKINTMLFLLKKETHTGSKNVYPDAMEARVHYNPNLIGKFEETITQYKACLIRLYPFLFYMGFCIIVFEIKYVSGSSSVNFRI